MPSFQFKKFSLKDDACAMKIGTDAVLLGSWARTDDIEGNEYANILDVGTGCGIIALMMAQRTKAMLDAVEIDEQSSLCCAENFLASPWPNRLKLFQDEFTHFAANSVKTYDLICCNPPFFTSSLKNPDPKRAIARHDIHLSLNSLFHSSLPILNAGGVLALIYPFLSVKNIYQAASENNLFIKNTAAVRSAPGKEPVRIMLELCKKEVVTATEDFTIRNADNTFSEEYRNLTKDFYLAF